MSQGTLFDHPVGIRRVVPLHPAEVLKGYAELAAGDATDALLDLAERCARAILTAQGTMAVWEVRVGLGQVGKLANDGKESLDGLGKLGTRMGLVASGRERPPEWVSKHLPKSHLNVNTRWRYPTAEERGEMLGRAQRKGRKA